MGTETGAGAALDAGQGLARLLVEMQDLDDAGADAGPAAGTFCGAETQAAAGPEFKGPGIADLGAGSIRAAQADFPQKTALKTAGGADLQGRLGRGEAVPDHPGAGQHAGIAADAFGHVSDLQDLRQITIPLS